MKHRLLFFFVVFAVMAASVNAEAAQKQKTVDIQWQYRKSETFEDVCSVDDIREFYLAIELENYYLKNAIDQLSPIENTTINGKPVTTKMISQKLIQIIILFMV